MKCRILYFADKRISVIHPAPKSKRSDETEEQWLGRVFAKATPEGVDFDDVEKDTLPNREFRSAWEGEKITGIKINPTKKREIEDKRAMEMQ